MVSDNSANICDTDCPRITQSCGKIDCSPYSLHDDIHNVIDTMGPPTPMFPLDIGCESADDTTISSVGTGETVTNSSNSSFVEVLIKNHHKSKTPKKNEQFCKRVKSPAINNTVVQTSAVQTSAVQTSAVKTAKEVQFQDYRSSTSPSLQQKGFDKMESKKYPSGIVTNVLPPCPHAPHSYYQVENKPFSNGVENSRIKHDSSYTIFPSNKSVINEDSRKSEKLNAEGQYINREFNKHNMVYRDDSDDNPQCAPTFDSSCNYKAGFVKEKMELYYFDHGNAAYYNTTDSPPAILADYLAEKTEIAATKFWAQIFGIVNVAVSLVTSFILQLFRFILFSIIRPLTVGLIQIFSDYFLKPFLSVIFNGLIQPPLIFMYNILTSVRDMFEPMAHALGFFLKEISVIFRACRLVEIRKSESCRTV